MTAPTEVREAAESMAARIIRANLAASVAPDLDRIADQTGLEPREVGYIRDRILSGKKDLPTTYRAPGRVVPPAAPGPAPAPVAVPAPAAATVLPEQWRRGLDHPVRRIRGKAERIAALIAEVEADLAAEGERDALRAKEAKLAAELAKVRAALKPSMQRSATSTEQVPCEECGALMSPHGLSIHRARKHPDAS